MRSFNRLVLFNTPGSVLSSAEILEIQRPLLAGLRVMGIECDEMGEDIKIK